MPVAPATVQPDVDLLAELQQGCRSLPATGGTPDDAEPPASRPRAPSTARGLVSQKATAASRSPKCLSPTAWDHLEPIYSTFCELHGTTVRSDLLIPARHGPRYWKPLRHLEPGHRVFAYKAGRGYAGIGLATGTMIPARDAEVEIDGRRERLLNQPDVGGAWRDQAASEDPEVTETVVPVRWLAKRPIEDAFREPGLFASQLSACKLRDERTIEAVQNAFGLNPEGGLAAIAGTPRPLSRCKSTTRRSRF